MAEKLTLQLETRSSLGKKVRFLRRDGLVPGNVYARGKPSVSVQAPLQELRRVFRAVERNAVVEARIAGETGTRPVVMREVQRHPVTREVLHVDLYEVDLSRRIVAPVNLVLVGASEAVHDGGTLVQNLDHILVEGLPLDMPSHIDVDLSALKAWGDSIHVSSLPVPATVRLVSDPTATVATVSAPRILAAEEVVEAEAAGAEAAAAAAEAAD